MAQVTNGILVVDKAEGWTSHDVCAFIRSRFRIPKVGHAGTLDPLATGVLVVLLGQATKRSQELSSCDKEYFGSIQLGIQTDTHDISGTVLNRGDWQHLTEAEVRATAQKFTGVLQQLPPMVSALKHNGVRLYRLARAGKTVERPKRSVTVHEFRIEEVHLPLIRFFAHVSKGTYLRTLVNDMGEVLGSFAALSQLRRVRSGSFTLDDAITIDQLKKIDREKLIHFVKGQVPVSVD
ncbi:MAG: tRNA pseudouridine(55) synthase TruB [Omnitrophica bacterium RIFCSPHIGHO2_02_FULL_46_11]|nr:MAG: tRNA pseudouridine(55) synthase TruB [Omnitrophica bacterium RIFCSPHIGHO2_02_FULL_46_11]OGW86363.1 MAG: tRNA pseudouridine(55) synthase TruB [Omnitrophica bacterium RIFCSPLOWO2_01_FULL_45_10b]